MINTSEDSPKGALILAPVEIRVLFSLCLVVEPIPSESVNKVIPSVKRLAPCVVLLSPRGSWLIISTTLFLVLEILIEPTPPLT